METINTHMPYLTSPSFLIFIILFIVVLKLYFDQIITQATSYILFMVTKMDVMQNLISKKPPAGENK